MSRYPGKKSGPKWRVTYAGGRDRLTGALVTPPHIDFDKKVWSGPFEARIILTPDGYGTDRRGRRARMYRCVLDWVPRYYRRHVELWSERGASWAVLVRRAKKYFNEVEAERRSGRWT